LALWTTAPMAIGKRRSGRGAVDPCLPRASGLLPWTGSSTRKAVRRPGQRPKRKSRCSAGLAASYGVSWLVELAERETGQERLLQRGGQFAAPRTDGPTDDRISGLRFWHPADAAYGRRPAGSRLVAAHSIHHATRRGKEFWQAVADGEAAQPSELGPPPLRCWQRKPHLRRHDYGHQGKPIS